MTRKYPDEPLYGELQEIYLRTGPQKKPAMRDRFNELWRAGMGMSDADAMKQTLLEFDFLPVKYQGTMLQMDGAEEYEDILKAQDLMGEG